MLAKVKRWNQQKKNCAHDFFYSVGFFPPHSLTFSRSPFIQSYIDACFLLRQPSAFFFLFVCLLPWILFSQQAISGNHEHKNEHRFGKRKVLFILRHRKKKERTQICLFGNRVKTKFYLVAAAGFYSLVLCNNDLPFEYEMKRQKATRVLKLTPEILRIGQKKPTEKTSNAFKLLFIY